MSPADEPVVSEPTAPSNFPARRVWRGTMLSLLVGGLILLPLYCYLNFFREIPLVLSPQTALFTAPLRPDGTVDLVAAINQKYFADADSPDNLLPLLWQVIGVNQEDLDRHADDLESLKELLDLAAVPKPRRWNSIEDETRKSLVAQGWDSEHPEWQQEMGKVSSSTLETACSSSFTRDEYPAIAEPLLKPANVFREANQFRQRSRCLVPITAGFFEYQVFPATRLVVGDDYAFLHELCLFALLQLGNGHPDEAMDALLTAAHLADAFAETMESQMNYASNALYQQSFVPAVVACCEHPQITTEQKQALLEHLLKPQPMTCVEQVNQGYHIVFLRLQADIHSGIVEDADWTHELALGFITKLPFDINTFAQVYFDAIRELFNQTQPAHPLASLKAMEELGEKWKSKYEEKQTLLETCLLVLAGQQARGYCFGSRAIHSTLIHYTYSYMLVSKMLHLAQRRALATWIAISLYRDQTGHFPETLSDLVPDFLPELPEDPFAPEQPLQYEQQNGQARLFSVGFQNEYEEVSPEETAVGTLSSEE